MKDDGDQEITEVGPPAITTPGEEQQDLPPSAAAMEAAATVTTERGHIIKSASLVTMGTFLGSFMGMVRSIIIAWLGPSIIGPFSSALSPVTSFNDLMINGAINGALVPTFNDVASQEKKEEFERLLSTLINLILIIGGVASILFIFVGPWFVTFINPNYQHYTLLVGGHLINQETLTIRFSQIIFFSVLGLGPFAILQAALYAKKEFGWPALSPIAYHIGIILGAIVMALLSQHYIGPYALPFGVVIGAIGEVAILIPGMRNQHVHYRFVLDIKHPAIRNVLKLYAPIALSYLVSSVFVYLDQNWTNEAPGNPAANLTAMTWGTQLTQFPVGLVALALSSAVLPTLAEYVRNGNTEQFKGVLLLGYRIGLLLMIPATAGLIVLGYPIITLLFQHGSTTAADAHLGYIALVNYSYQLPFLAIDQLLLAAFYARKDTIKPVVVGFVSYLGYIAVAAPLRHTVGMPALVMANTVQNSVRPIMLIILLRMAIGPLRIREMVPTVLKIFLATGVMVIIALGLQYGIHYVPLFSLTHVTGRFLTVIIVGALAAIAYFGTITLLKVEEITVVRDAILAKLGRKAPAITQK
jgi:putative peptidoglycan lipid II flippase